MLIILYYFLLSQITTCLIALLLILVLNKAYYNGSFIFNYWKTRNLPQPLTSLLIIGNMWKCIFDDYSGGRYLKHAYRVGRENGLKHFGCYTGARPLYMVVDPEYIKNVLQRDYHYFTDRGFYYNEKDDPLSANLFAIGGENWKTVREKLSQTFTTGKLKSMFDGLLECTNQMENAVNTNCLDGQAINILEIAECFTIDVIGSCVFGLQCNSFKHPNAEFRRQGKKVFSFTYFRIFRVMLAFGYPELARSLGVTLFDKNTTDFFMKVVEDAIDYRKANHVTRKDFLQLLIQLEEEENTFKNNRATIKKLAAQAFIFFAAGFETSATTIAYCLYELSINTVIQERVRREIEEVYLKYGDKISYEALSDLKYTNQVIEETLRKYPPVSFLTRKCVKDYKIGDENVIIEKGIIAVISVLGLHHDPESYPEPKRFNPERFSDDNRANIRPFTYLPFGEGPRICIGLRFGLMQVKVGLVTLLRKYKFSLNSKTELPLKIEKYSFTLKPKSKILLDVCKI